LENTVVKVRIRIRHLAAWIACFSILLAALAPTVSRSRADICATANPVSAGEEDHTAHHHSSTPAKPALHFDHCPFCFTHAGSFGLVPLDSFTLPDASSYMLFPSLFYQSPHTLFVWATPQSRAPPA
jgi:hypothetical protein